MVYGLMVLNTNGSPITHGSSTVSSRVAACVKPVYYSINLLKIAEPL